MGDNHASLMERQFTNLSAKYNHAYIINIYECKQNGRYFADDIYGNIFLIENVFVFNEKVCIVIQI